MGGWGGGGGGGGGGQLKNGTEHVQFVLQSNYQSSRHSGHVDIGVKSRKIALGLKGRFYADLCFRPKGKILRQVWC